MKRMRPATQIAGRVHFIATSRRLKVYKGEI